MDSPWPVPEGGVEGVGVGVNAPSLAVELWPSYAAVASIFVRAALSDSRFTAQHSRKILPLALSDSFFPFLKELDVYLSPDRRAEFPTIPSKQPSHLT